MAAAADVVGLADRVAAAMGTFLAHATGLTFDGSTSGITSVLVFGAGTNYALLLVSRYRDELHRTADHRAALRIAVRRAGPAILASNLTVVLALLTLLLGLLPNTRASAPSGRWGCWSRRSSCSPRCLRPWPLCGRKVFWPFIPRDDGRDTTRSGAWHAVAEKVVRRPAAVASVSLIASGGLCPALPFAHIGLAQSEQFRVRAESSTG